nr:MAG: hypothetical protein DIU55_02420 [Bacillota bacterium]
MRRWLVVLGIVLALLTGCARVEPTAEAAAAAAQAFMESLAAGDFDRVWNALTPEAQRRMGTAPVAAYLDDHQVTFAAVDAAREVEPGVMRVAVRGVAVRDPGRTVEWPEWWLTLRWEEDRWAVAWAEPLFEPALSAYHNTDYPEQLDLARDIVAIDPHHYRGHLELHYAFRGLGRIRQAEHALNAAWARATGAQRADVMAARARFKLAIGAPAEALALAREALSLARPYAPGTYSASWQAETLIVGARAALALGDREAAQALADEAAELDPANAALAVFRYQLAAEGRLQIGSAR